MRFNMIKQNSMSVNNDGNVSFKKKQCLTDTQKETVLSNLGLTQNELSKASESDLSAGNSILIDTQEGMKGLPVDSLVKKVLAENVAPEFQTDKFYPLGSRVTYGDGIYEFFADHAAGEWLGETDARKVIEDDVFYHAKNGAGYTNGTTSFHVIYEPVKKGHTYAIILRSTWDVSDIADETNVLYVQYNYSETPLAIKKKNFDKNKLFYTLTATKDDVVNVSVRGNVGEYVAATLVDVTFLQEVAQAKDMDFVLDDTLSPDISFFESIGVIGASFESGIVYKDSSTPVAANYAKSWPQILSREKGIDVTNFSYGGADSKNWLTNATYGLAALNADTAKELYILNLGSNDAYHYGNEYIGTVADIGTDADTYFGNMSKIINAIKTKSSNARIILAELRTNVVGTISYNYNIAVRELAEYFGLPLVVPHADPFYSTETYTTFVGGHPLYMGYAGMAKAWRRMIENCMAENLSYFNHIPE